MASNYWVVMQKQKAARTSWLRLNPNLNDASGIYVLTRTDELGLMYAYIGQAKHILTRLAQHSLGYQHIDLSLKKHKLYSKDNPYGWNVGFINCDESKLNEYERKFIYEYASKGYQLRNKTSGGQNEGKTGIDDNKAPKGYRDGLKQGRINTIRQIKELFDKYLVFLPLSKPECLKKNGELKDIYLKKWKEFKELLNEGTEDNNTVAQKDD